MRLRTEKTSLNGTGPALLVEDVFTHTKPLNIVISYNFQEQKVYVNGRMRSTSVISGGDFKNWDSGYRLILGNVATDDRPWLGEISYLEIYYRPLDSPEIQKSYHTLRSWI